MPPPADKYVLGQDHLASVRLYFQHWMWQRQLGYLLHPQITPQDGMKVADICCGTGIWLIDLAKQLPKSELHGFDITSDKFPNQHWLPKNITLSVLDIHKPIPLELQGEFDVVHVGLAVLVVQRDNPRAFLDQLLLLLKPTGYIQWEEADFGNLEINDDSSGLPHAGLDQLKEKTLSMMNTMTGNNYRWTRELQVPFEERNLSILDNKYLPIPDDIALPWTLQHLLGASEAITSLERQGVDTAEWWDAFFAASQDTNRGGSMRMGMVSILGKRVGKPRALSKSGAKKVTRKASDPQ